jgi:hypothetical protein
MDEMNGKEFIMSLENNDALKKTSVIFMSSSPIEVLNEVPEKFYKEVMTKPLDLLGLLNDVRNNTSGISNGLNL